MSYVNLIGKNDDYYVPEIYSCYETGKKEGSPQWTKAFHNVRSRVPAHRSSSSAYGTPWAHWARPA